MNQNPEQQARDKIDSDLTRCGWLIQHKSKIKFNTYIRTPSIEYQTSVGAVDSIPFIDKKTVRVSIEWGFKKKPTLIFTELQSQWTRF